MDCSVVTINMATRTTAKTIGSSQNFFRVRRNSQNSLRNCNMKLTVKVAGADQ